MAKRRRKIPSVDQLALMKASGEDHSCEIKYQNTDHDRIMIIVHNKCQYPDAEEAFLTVRALVRVGTCQWGEEWLDRVRDYLGQIVVLGGEK